MGKHKIVKSAAAVALTASVVATAAAPGASAASYKVNSKDQLVHTKSGKLVKGWKVFGGKLYKNGKLAPAKKYKIIGSGAARQLFYGPTLKKGYKTAINKTLLFKDGKLADGWKQAGKNERLYKNGKLDKGYTVYTDVEGEKFLYQNGYLKKGQKTATRGGETLLFVDGKLAKGYVLHEASKTLYNNGKVAKGLVQYPEKDGKFYNDGKLANGEINGAEYKDGVLVAKDIASVKAINGTTVEVTFKEAQKADDVKAADYKIEGLEVKNAAVKQTDSKVVVLTTSAQEAAKEYTLVYKEADTKTFTGVSAVIPTSVKITKGSQQGVIGKEVTVEAQVTVAEGQSKAGIPVTIVVDSNKDTNNGGSNNIAKDYKVEVYTDENGVAKYSYTQYASPSEDTVTAYPTGDASVKSVAGKVYWGQTARLAISEVTTGNTIANDGKKVYKVAAPELAEKYVFVAFKENVNVTPDKLTTGVKVVDTANKLHGSSDYPYEVTTGGKKYVAFKLDAKGEANFTLQGTEATVTPIVFSDSQFNAEYENQIGQALENILAKVSVAKLDATELQAAAPAVTFAKAFTNQFTVVAEGEQNAAAATIAENGNLTENLGGRDYTVTVTKADGTLAPAGTVVNVGFKKGDYATGKGLWFESESQALTPVNVSNLNNGLTAVVGKDGKATFTLVGEKDGFAKPTVFFDNGQGTDAKAGLDDTDLQTTGEVTYFVDAKVANAQLVSSAAPTNKVTASTPVTFTYQSLDQNGKAYETKAFTPTFQVSASNADVVVKDANGNYVVANDEVASTVKAGQTKTFKLSVTNGKSAIVVQPKDGLSADVTVTASTTDAVLPAKTASVSFTKVVTAVENAVAKINAAQGYANDKDLYNTVVGENIVTPANLAAVKDAVGVAYTNKGKDLTAEEITTVVKATVKSLAEDAANSLSKTAPTQAEIDKAQAAVDLLPTGDVKTAAQAKIDAAKNLLAANTEVAALEKKATPTQEDIDAAQAKVDAVEAGDAKTALQAKVDAVQATTPVNFSNDEVTFTGAPTGVTISFENGKFGFAGAYSQHTNGTYTNFNATFAAPTGTATAKFIGSDGTTELADYSDVAGNGNKVAAEITIGKNEAGSEVAEVYSAPTFKFYDAAGKLIATKTFKSDGLAKN